MNVPDRIASIAHDARDEGAEMISTWSDLARSKLHTLATAIDPVAAGQWMLRGVGLQRRPSALSRVAMGAGVFVAGAAVGAGVAMLLAPKSGEQTRAQLTRWMTGARRDAEETLQNAEAAAKDGAREMVANAEAAVTDGAHEVASSLEGALGADGNRAPRARAGISHRAPGNNR